MKRYKAVPPSCVPSVFPNEPCEYISVEIKGAKYYAYPIEEPEKIVNPMPEGSGNTPSNGICWREVARWMDEITAAVNALREEAKS